jgi:CRP-like cAMP-binding protein
MLSLMETIIFLKGVPIFQRVDAEGLRRLAERAEEKIAEAGSIIVRENEIGEIMYIIKRGRVEVFNESGGKKNTIAVLGEKAFFGEMAILEEAPRSASVKALEDSVLITIDKDSFRYSVYEYPDIAFEVFKCLSSRLREANKRLKSA